MWVGAVPGGSVLWLAIARSGHICSNGAVKYYIFVSWVLLTFVGDSLTVSRPSRADCPLGQGVAAVSTL